MTDEQHQIVNADVEQSTNPSEQSIEQPTEQPEQTSEGHASEPSEQTSEQAGEQPQPEQSTQPEQAVEQTQEQASGEQAEQSSEQNTEQSTQQPKEEQTDKPEEQQAPSKSEDIKTHLFAIRTTGGQEKVVLNLLQNRVRTQNVNIQSVLLVDNLKGYVVLEAMDANEAFNAIQGVRHIRGQLRGELEFKDIEGYLVKKSTVTELAVDKVVEIIGGPFKGMKATITRVDKDKEEATVILLDAPYQLPVTVDANYLKLSAE